MSVRLLLDRSRLCNWLRDPHMSGRLPYIWFPASSMFWSEGIKPQSAGRLPCMPKYGNETCVGTPFVHVTPYQAGDPHGLEPSNQLEANADGQVALLTSALRASNVLPDGGGGDGGDGGLGGGLGGVGQVLLMLVPAKTTFPEAENPPVKSPHISTFPPTTRRVREVMPASQLSGIVACSLLLPMLRSTRDTIVLQLLGRVPVMLLLCTERAVSWVSLDHSAGSVPEKLLEFRLIDISVEA